MAEDLADGEFWLPSDFLTDDDILLDFKGSPSIGSDLDLVSIGSATASTETESDEDELAQAHHLTTYCSLHSPYKIWGLSTSPQSTLCGCGSKDGSSPDGTPNLPVSPPPPPPGALKTLSGTTLDLLHKAADEVARYKMNTERPKTTTCGTGFFDCSTKIKNNNSKSLFCPPPPPPCFTQPQFAPLSHRMRPQFNNGNQLLGFGPHAWAPLGAHNRHMHVRPPVFVGPIGPKRESVGTGVFLPRRVSSPVDTRTKKPEGNSMKMRSGKGNSQPQRKRNSKPPTTNPIEIQLPKEWSY